MATVENPLHQNLVDQLRRLGFRTRSTNGARRSHPRIVDVIPLPFHRENESGPHRKRPRATVRSPLQFARRSS